MKQCPMCRAALDDGARFCIYCASSLDEKTYVITKTYGKKTALKLAAIAVSVILAAAAVISGAAAAVKGRAPAPAPAETESAGTPEYTVTDPEDTTSAEDPAETPEAVTSAPESAVPADMTSSAEATAPETTAPETTTPETTIPETTIPETTVPETTAPTTTAPETTAPTTTAPETTADEITTAPETEGEESSVQIQTPGIAIVSADSFAGGPPENEEEMLTKQYLFAERSRFGDWVERIFGYDNPEIGSSVQLEDLVMPDRVYFSDGGNAVVTARLYTDGKDVDFRMLKYSVGMDQADTSFEDHVRENSGMKRPAGWRGLMMEAGIDVDPYSEDEMAKQYPEATGIRPVSYEYWVTYLTGADRTIKVTIEKRVGKILPEGGYETSAWWYPDVTDWFTLAEYVD